MISTVVGSYPVYKKEKTTKDKLLSAIGLYDPCKIAIYYAVEQQLKAGIDIISDGQVRGEMVEIFAKEIPGFKIEGNTYVINSKIAKPHNSIGSNDLKLAINYLKKITKEMDLSKSEIAKKGVKGIITGPSTIVQSSRIGPIYKDKNIAIIDMAKALKEECLSLEKAGAKLIQIDEPFLSIGLIDMEIAKEAIAIITKELSIPVSMHSCGDISNAFSDFINFDVDIIDCEFAGHPRNIDVLEKYANDLGSKKIGLGCIDTKKSNIESIDEIAHLIKKGVDIVGKENLYIDPDCGMKLFNNDIAFSKLKNMVEAMKSLE
ncbi:MAG: methionine synthase [Methanobrevibacter sp.]|jgi:5-methyltetrahydropteroyltriglutamate--homocysteine methyltransferase|nr:methionine synthase [Methanobrevibacter sp.]